MSAPAVTATPATEGGNRLTLGRIWQTFGPLLSLIILSMLI
ncbi:MAG: hypothetical protein R2848_03650 [Thermomicrobiales bacterium]